MSLSFFCGQPTSAVPDRLNRLSMVSTRRRGTISGARCGGRIFAEDGVGDVRRQTSPCGERLWERRINGRVHMKRICESANMVIVYDNKILIPQYIDLMDKID